MTLNAATIASSAGGVKLSFVGAGNIDVSSTLLTAAINTVTMNGAATGLVTLLGANTYAGATTINSGTLAAGIATAFSGHLGHRCQ